MKKKKTFSYNLTKVVLTTYIMKYNYIWVTDALQLQLTSSYKLHFMTLILYLYSKLTVNNH